MSAETQQWLDENTVTGFVSEHGKAWHARSADQDNQYDGPVPIERVERLFDWEALRTPIYTAQETPVIDPDGTLRTEVTYQEVPGKIAMTDSRDGHVFNVFTTRYQDHQYKEWLVESVGTLLDVSMGDLHIGSAGLLVDSGQAWVQVRPATGIQIGGDAMLPWILAATSHNGSLVTSYRGAKTRVVCDNTLAAGLWENQHVVKIKHTSKSMNRLAEAREALGLIFAEQESFVAEVDKLMHTPVTPDQWREIVNTLEPIPEPTGDNEKSRNSAAKRRGILHRLYDSDPRVTTFTGTAWGALMTVNTRDHWEGTPSTRTASRQMKRTVAGKVDADDRRTLDVINRVLVPA